MRRHELDLSLNELRTLLMEMSNRVKHALLGSIEALKTLDTQLAQHWIDKDQELNELEIQVDEIGSRLIALQQPVAKDLRRVLVAFRIANDLERMGDLSVSISKVVLRMEQSKWSKPLIEIPRMGLLVVRMVDDAIVAYFDENIDLAYEMASKDDQIDVIYGELLKQLLQTMTENPDMINVSMMLCFVGRYIERIADHATNIGEDVAYLVNGSRPELNR